MSDLRGLIERDYARAYGQALIAQADREPRRVYLGEGKTIEQAQTLTKTTSEGVKSCQSILDLANRNGVEMPITEQVVNVIHNGTSAEKVLKAFMSRPTTAEEGQELMEHM